MKTELYFHEFNDLSSTFVEMHGSLDVPMIDEIFGVGHV